MTTGPVAQRASMARAAGFRRRRLLAATEVAGRAIPVLGVAQWK
jgi:hypothetical protein